jgi:signal transduction histidine kinase
MGATSHLDTLNKITDAVKIDQKGQEKRDSLVKACELFTLEAEKLEKAYQELRDHFHEVNLELARSNAKLNAKVLELDALTTYLNSILNDMTQGLIFIDLKGKVTTYNKAAELILAIPTQDILFQSFWEHFSDDLFGFSLKNVLSQKQAPLLSYIRWKNPQKKAKELEVHCSFMLRPVQENTKEIETLQGMIILLRDITDIRQLQRIAQRNDRMKELGEMAAMVAHEIRNPIGGIKGFASLLKRDLAAQPHMLEMAQSIIEGTDDLNRLVTQILNFSRPLETDIRKTNLIALIHDLVHSLQTDANFNPHNVIRMSHHVDPLIISIDPLLIKSALLNLIVNGLEAMSNGGVLSIKTYPEDDHVTIEVTDTGSGISSENLSKLFSPFFTTKDKGNGFGLTDVLKIVQAHEGTIEVHSEVDKGTSFIIKIPLK